LIQKSSDY